MRRQAVHFADDIRVEEIIDMAKAQGFHVRFVGPLVVVDRVPGIVRREAAPQEVPVVRFAGTPSLRRVKP